MSFTKDAIIIIYEIIDVNIIITGVFADFINEKTIYNAAKIKAAGAASLPS